MPSSLLPTSKTTRKPPRERLISNDQMDTFCERDTITSLVGLYETTAPDGFQFKKSNDHALFYNLVFDKNTKFPRFLESIKYPVNFDKKTYFICGKMHITKNIRNNLLKGKKFVFPEFIYNDGLNIDINFPAGCIQWKDLQDIYDKGRRIVSQIE